MMLSGSSRRKRILFLVTYVVHWHDVLCCIGMMMMITIDQVDSARKEARLNALSEVGFDWTSRMDKKTAVSTRDPVNAW